MPAGDPQVGPPSVLHDLLDAAARRHATRPALTHAGRTWDYARLRAASLRAAGWLRERGVGRGDRVLLALPSGLATAALVYGCSRVGAAFCVLHEQVRGPALAHVRADSEATLLVTADDGPLPPDEDDKDAEAGEDPEPEPVPADGQAAHETAGPLSVDPVCLIYTSGSTGPPKAVVSTHAQQLFAARAVHGELAYRAEDVVYCALPLSFDYGLYQLFLSALAGAHLWLGSASDVGPILLKNLRRSGATVLPVVPSLAQSLARMLPRYGADGVGLRLLTNTGSAMPPQVLAELRAALPGLRVQLMFGLTECKRVAIMPPDEDLRRPGACGRALPGTEVLVVDERGRRVAPGTVGEIVVRGPHVMAGYWRRPDETARRFPRAEGLFPELRTGDFGHLDEDGYLYFSGRRDDLYKQRGFRVSAEEVEAAARRVPGVRGAAVLPPAGDGEESVLCVAGALGPGEVLAALKREIEPYKVPARCLVVRELPLTGNGKTDRKALRAIAAES
ncbi:class I adenylate-forming enzyme family protein [Streptomyces sp. ME19-01-6]|uniref:class I adenylate-forming enzyme family protein n=1 Tax=Streptomyces sp. ME19-01-6 TaxID=3028686 RepID=UPI00299FEEFA|nr:class I adenylate-forming enzyme family protein [Streptomyces sp. ME19-01-6]MDX3231462.1 class I adenylate-forming enzyme family protein [Streptomyces sp. ME19-01-6]